MPPVKYERDSTVFVDNFTKTERFLTDQLINGALETLPLIWVMAEWVMNQNT